ncbi:MAG: hypothetical protein JST22_09945 [Bacteroidetes bacterium]|nr:hypothetical protein [Bacteroidota bacterium]
MKRQLSSSTADTDAPLPAVQLPIAPNRCVHACLEQSAAGFYTITIDPSPILCICQ